MLRHDILLEHREHVSDLHHRVQGVASLATGVRSRPSGWVPGGDEAGTLRRGMGARSYSSPVGW